MNLRPAMRGGGIALIAATYGVSGTAPGLLAWIEDGREWPLQSANLDRPQVAETAS